MDEQKKPVGRPQIYQGWQPEQTGRRRPGPAQRPQEERRKGAYRPLAVTEERTDLRKVLQMPGAQPEQKQPAGHHAAQPEQKQPTGHHTAQPEQKQPTGHHAAQPEQKQPTGHHAAQPEQKQPAGHHAAQPEQKQPTGHHTVQPERRQQIRQFEPRPKQVPGQTEIRSVEPRRKQVPEQRPQQPAEQKKMIAAKRRREQENERKIRALWGVFGFLCVALTAAIFYEIILGHGIKETGAERMEEQKQELVLDTEQNNIEILTPGGELVSEIKERENRRSLSKQTESTEADMQ